MSKGIKLVEELTVEDLTSNAVWQFVNDDSKGETAVRAINRIPVASLAGKLVGTKVRLANGQPAWAILGNISSNNPRSTEHFPTVSIEHSGSWFHLARYHDSDYKERGPKGLANFLGLNVDDVFPIAYDIRSFATGEPSSLAGEIAQNPKERLTEDEIMDLVFESMD